MQIQIISGLQLSLNPIGSTDISQPNQEVIAPSDSVTPAYRPVGAWCRSKNLLAVVSVPSRLPWLPTVFMEDTRFPGKPWRPGQASGHLSRTQFRWCLDDSQRVASKTVQKNPECNLREGRWFVLQEGFEGRKEGP